MAKQLKTEFVCESEALGEGTLEVARFHGDEEVSAPYWFEIDLISSDSEIDLASVLAEPGYLGIRRETGDLVKIHGVFSEFEQQGQGTLYTHYHAVLVPRLWLLSLQRQSQIHQEVSIRDILQSELDAGGLTEGPDFELRLQGEYPTREYVVQYEETDLEFLSRLMEHYGIFYFFEQGEDREKLIFADSNDAFVSITGDPTLPYRPTMAVLSEEDESIHALLCRQKRIPKQMILRDYNYRTPSVDLKAETDIDQKGRWRNRRLLRRSLQGRRRGQENREGSIRGDRLPADGLPRHQRQCSAAGRRAAERRGMLSLRLESGVPAPLGATRGFSCRRLGAGHDRLE